MDFECQGVNAAIRKIHVSWPYLHPCVMAVPSTTMLQGSRCTISTSSLVQNHLCVCFGNFILLFAKSLKRMTNWHFFTVKPVIHEAHPWPPPPAKKNDRWGGVDRARNRSPSFVFLVLWLACDCPPFDFAVPQSPPASPSALLCLC
jgi:hypothetical protein